VNLDLGDHVVVPDLLDDGSWTGHLAADLRYGRARDAGT
jgi:hypothetical protein